MKDRGSLIEMTWCLRLPCKDTEKELESKKHCLNLQGEERLIHVFEV
jgi:hypothetical protein